MTICYSKVLLQLEPRGATFAPEVFLLVKMGFAPDTLVFWTLVALAQGSGFATHKVAFHEIVVEAMILDGGGFLGHS